MPVEFRCPIGDVLPGLHPDVLMPGSGMIFDGRQQ